MHALSGGRLQFESVLFATDFSPGSYPASLYAKALAEHLKCPLVVLHVFHPNPNARGGLEGQRSSLEELLELAVDALTPQPAGATSLLIEGDAASVIAQQVNEAANTLLLLGAHGRNTVTKEVLTHLTVPALTVGAPLPEIHKTLSLRRILFAADCSPLSVQAAAVASAFAASFLSHMDVVDESQASVTTQLAQEEILRRLQNGEHDLLVLGMDALAAFPLIAEAPCPVLTIPGAYAP